MVEQALPEYDAGKSEFAAKPLCPPVSPWADGTVLQNAREGSATEWADWHRETLL